MFSRINRGIDSRHHSIPPCLPLLLCEGKLFSQSDGVETKHNYKETIYNCLENGNV